MKQGVFWVIPKAGGFELVCRFDDTRGHCEIWEEIASERPALRKYDYEHFPRGRVWKSGEGATVFIDPKIKKLTIIDKIAEKFSLETYEIISDGTE